MTPLSSKKYLNYSHTHWLQRAAEILEEDAEALKHCHTSEGEWSADEPEVQEHYNEMREAARAVRAEHERAASAAETPAPRVDDELANAITFYEQHVCKESSAAMSFINQATIEQTAAFLRELQMRRIRMQRSAAETAGKPFAGLLSWGLRPVLPHCELSIRFESVEAAQEAREAIRGFISMQSSEKSTAPLTISKPPQIVTECPKCRTQLAFEGDECGLCKEETT